MQIISHKETTPNIQEKILTATTTLCQKVESLDSEVQLLKKASNSQQHDSKYAELRRPADDKRSELKGDVEKHLKTQNTNKLSTAGTNEASTSKGKNINLNNLFEKPFIPRKQIIDITPIPQTSTYAESLNREKKIYNHINQSYIENIYTIQTFLNLKPRSTTTTEKTQDYVTQHLQGTTN